MKRRKPKTEDYIKHIQKTLGAGNSTLGKGWNLNFNDEKLKHFLEKLSEEKLRFLIRAVTWFRIHMEPISYLLNKNEGSKKGWWLAEFYKPAVWSRFALTIMFAVLDEFTRKDEYQRRSLESFLAEKLPIKDEEKLRELFLIYKKDNPPAVSKRITNLLESNLSEAEIKEIIRDYKSSEENKGEKLNTLQEVVSDWYDKIRSGFVHGTSLKSTYHESEVLALRETESENAIARISSISDKGQIIEIYREISTSQIMFFCWKAIFHSLGYDGEINSIYITEEIKESHNRRLTKKIY